MVLVCHAPYNSREYSADEEERNASDASAGGGRQHMPVTCLQSQQKGAHLQRAMQTPLHGARLLWDGSLPL